MEYISLKEWIIVGTLSGVVIGFLLFLVVAPMFISTCEIGPVTFSHLISATFNYVFSGIVIGLVLFLMRNKLQQRKLFKCLFVSIGIIVGPLIILVVLDMLFYSSPSPFISAFFDSWFIRPWIASYLIYGMFTELIYQLTGLSSFLFLFPPLFSLLFGVAFGFLINYFINRIERKASK